MKRLLAIFVLLATPLYAQSPVGNSSTGNSLRDPAQRNYRIGPTAPSTCKIGDVFFDDDATAGSNWFGCTTANTWTGEGGSGASLTVANTWTEDQTFELDNFACFGVNGGCIGQVSADVVDAFMILPDTTGNAVVIAEYQDRAFNFAHGATTNPTLFIHSNTTAATTKWISFTHDDTDGIIDVGAGTIKFSDSITIGGDILSPTSGNHGFWVNSHSYGGFYPNYASGTPDGAVISVGTTSFSVHIAENTDVYNGVNLANGPCGAGACVDPTLVINNAVPAATTYVSLSTQGTTEMGEVQTNLGKVEIGGNKLNISEAGATSIVRFTFTTLQVFGATVFYTVSDGDGTDMTARSGNIVIQGVNKAATETCTIASGRDIETEDGSSIAASGGHTLTYTWSMDTTPVNGCDLQILGVSNLGANTFDVTYSIVLNSNALITVTPQ